MSISKSMTNQQKQDFVPDALVSGGKSMKRGESLETQIELGPIRALQAPLITGWNDAKGKEYSTSIAQQVAYNAQALQRIEAQLAILMKGAK